MKKLFKKKGKLFLSIVLVATVIVTCTMGSFTAAVNNKYMVRTTEINNKNLSYASYDFINRVKTTNFDDGTKLYEHFTKQYNYSDSDIVYNYKDSAGYLNVVVANCTSKLKNMSYNCKFTNYKFDKNYKCILKTNVTTPSDFDQFGAFYHGSDKCNYVVVGRNNTTQSSTKLVIKVIRYNEDFSETLGVANLQGGVTVNGHKGIYEVFKAGNCRLSLYGTRLIVYTTRTVFSSNTKHHQTNLALYISTKTMKVTSTKCPYVSHSFNEFVQQTSSTQYFADHGDAYTDRGLLLNVYRNGGLQTKTLQKYKGAAGRNYTGTTVGAMQVSCNKVLIAGTSVPHYNAVKGVKGYNSELKQNIYVATASLDGKSSSFKWITTSNPNGTIYHESPRLVRISSSRYVLMYNRIYGTTRTLVCKLLNSYGNVIKTKEYKNIYFSDSSDPLYINGEIVWVSPQLDYLCTTYNYVYHIPYSDLKA